MEEKKTFIGIHVLVKNGDKYLVVLRSEDDPEDPKTWDLPGGGAVEREQPLEGAVRETLEETGMIVAVTKILKLHGVEYHGLWTPEAVVEAEFIEGEVKLSPEHTEYKWITWQELVDIEPKSRNLKYLFM
ncbi:NUDIX domain-containing protein [Candidatus Parcubacteria bacterium]|nr:MAG: NUDIX domain-containing protein [Candidatus Parcubacteria bacterium]